MKLGKSGLVLIALSAIILIIGGVFFAMAAIPHTIASSTSSTTSTTSSSTSSTSTTSSTTTSTSSTPVWA
ncbi:sulfocyanin [Sulfolobus sp. S-194]|uniref:sulfocyanin n=1 Tax=Sulfolobus sp. S-194 TaxID=2512240 RepID=UPI001436D02F|nr:sulfocyanin [Sulfolobus sp. S-194]QIW24004.1 sulfocyanin [Sulfolobus sp. S-194]